MRAKPGELVAYGRRSRKTQQPEVMFEGGEGVPAAAIDLLREGFAEPRHTILCMLPNHTPEMAFTEDLAQRGYDLGTFRFRISLKSTGGKQPKRLQRIRIRPATLHARWGRDPDDGTPDFCCAWARPCSRRDANLLFSVFSTATYTAAQLIERRHHDVTFRKKLEDAGFDMRTLRFSVKKPTPVADEASEHATAE